MNQTQVAATGLDGVIAGDSGICFIDGENHKLYYRGYAVPELAEKSSFEEVCYLLLQGELPTRDQLADFRERMLVARQLPSQILAMIALVPGKTHPMDMLRSIVSSEAQHDSDVGGNSEEANYRKAIRLLSQVPVIVAAYHRLRRGDQPIPPSDDLSLAGNFLYMLTGERPDPYLEKVFDTCLILHADHGFNASTFTARVVAATLSDMYSACTAAIGALKGKLHGGANQDVMEMLLSIDGVEGVPEFLESMFAEGKKVPGFGHRVYRAAEDPRATSLREILRGLSDKLGDRSLLDISLAINEYVVKTSTDKGKPIYPNVDFFSASTYRLLGLDPSLFTPIFAMARMAGWCAHIGEQHHRNRLIRPRENYIGPSHRHYVSLEKR
jgi:citrate synthase